MAEVSIAPQTDATASAIIAEQTEITPNDGDVEMNGESGEAAPVNGNGDGPAEGEAQVGGENQAEEDGEEKLPEDACETLYLQNLNERVRLPVLKETLLSLFKPYNPLAPVIAHENVRMRGQAFVSFTDVNSANEARKDVAEFPLYGKPIQISFARGRSDSVIKKLGGKDEFAQHKVARLEQKKVKRRNNPLRKKSQAKLIAEQTTTAEGAAGAAGGAAQANKKQRLQMPDEYLPPNSVLFIQNLPEGTTSDDLREVFEVHPGLTEIRTIPAKKDIAFIEFTDENAATVAKDALHNFKIDGETKMKVTYARK